MTAQQPGKLAGAHQVIIWLKAKPQDVWLTLHKPSQQTVSTKIQNVSQREAQTPGQRTDWAA